MAAALRGLGCEVEIIDPEAGMHRVGDHGWLAELGFIVCRGRSVGLLALLQWAELQGVPTLNRREAIAAVLDKARMAIALAAGGIPTPAAFLGPVRELAAGVPEECYPLILKPVFGDNCRGLRLVANAEEMAEIQWPEPVALAQHFLANDGWDLKLYGIGREVWAVKKMSCLVQHGLHPIVKQDHEEVVQVTLTGELETLAHRCATLFGLELYGVDCIETARGPLVIEVNDFPNYTRVPGADAKLAEYVFRRAQEKKMRPR